ncbi:50S ribosomal protein L29 [bacterium HR34]|nr:50S ribosomal protein L29 [bacterium HR34]
MKKKEKQALKAKDEKDLIKLLAEKRKKLQELRFSISLGEKVKNIKEISKLKKEIAVILTFINQKRREKENKSN